MKNRKENTPFNLSGFLIAALMLLAFGTKEAHYFVHHQHVEVKICDAREGEHHFHDQDYIHDGCTLCDFTFSFFDFKTPETPDRLQLQPFIPTRTFSYRSFLSFKFPAFTLLRGPPVVC